MPLCLADAGDGVVVGDRKSDTLVLCKRKCITHPRGGVGVVGVEVHINTEKALSLECRDVGFTEDDSWGSILVAHAQSGNLPVARPPTYLW